MVYSEGTIIIIIVAFVQFKINFFFTEYDFAVQKMFIEAQNKSKIVGFRIFGFRIAQHQIRNLQNSNCSVRMLKRRLGLRVQCP